MLLQAANPAARPDLSLRASSRGSICAEDCDIGSTLRSLLESICDRPLTAVGARLLGLVAANDLCSFGSLPPRIPSSARGHASGLSAALRQARSSASASPPLGLRFPASPDPPQMQSFGLGRRGRSLGFA